MSFEYNATGIDPKEIDGPNFEPIPEGDYTLQIITCEERISQNKNPMVVAKCEIQHKDYLGRFVWHNITFLPEGKPGRGMALKFLKTIDQPYEQKFKVKSENWLGKIFDAHIVVDTYQGKMRNKIAYLKNKEQDTVPF